MQQHVARRLARRRLAVAPRRRASAMAAALAGRSQRRRRRPTSQAAAQPPARQGREAEPAAGRKSEQAIVVLVNDEPDHRLRDRAAGEIPGHQRQHRRAREGELQARWSQAESTNKQVRAILEQVIKSQSRQDAGADRRHLRGAQEAVRDEPAEAGLESARAGMVAAVQERGPGRADRRAAEAAGGQAARHRGVRRRRQAHPEGRWPSATR